jgi:hypothetical protein
MLRAAETASLIRLIQQRSKDRYHRQKMQQEDLARYQKQRHTTDAFPLGIFSLFLQPLPLTPTA